MAWLFYAHLSWKLKLAFLITCCSSVCQLLTFSSSIGPISTKLGTKHPLMKGNWFSDFYQIILFTSTSKIASAKSIILLRCFMKSLFVYYMMFTEYIKEYFCGLKFCHIIFQHILSRAKFSTYFDCFAIMVF